MISSAKADKRTKKITGEIAKQTNETRKANRIAENLAEQQVVMNEASRKK
ncbi:MAG: hypothetical protein VX690_09010 [Pseudomonadota bacterium]|nr:hypothetical protein [Pseudomonadota bacterium]